MKRALFAAGLAVITMAVVFYAYAHQAPDIYFVSPFAEIMPAVGDVTGDGASDILAASGDRLYVLEHSAAVIYGFKKIKYSIDITGHNPKKLLIGDINGDGLNEISICAYKTAIFDPVEAKRPFFYVLEDGALKPVWLGSRLSRPFDDYILLDADADRVCEIISAEFLSDGRMALTMYKWAEFGFDRICESSAVDKIENLVGKDGVISTKVTTENKKNRLRFVYDNTQEIPTIIIK